MRFRISDACVACAVAFLALGLWAKLAVAQAPTLSAPTSVGVGATVEVAWEGGAEPRDFITIVAEGTPEGRYDAYATARTSPVELVAPHLPGAYELRYLGADRPFPTLARQPLTVVDAESVLAAPAQVSAGADFTIEWTGPGNALDFIGLVLADAAEGTSNGPYKYTRGGSPLTLRAPDAAGEYELRYMLGTSPYRTLGRQPVTVTSTAASVSVAQAVAAGAPFEVAWQGPDNPRDFIAIVPAGAPARQYDVYVYTERGQPAVLTAPEIAGDYEVRYLTGQTYDTLAAAAFTVSPVSATLEAAPIARARCRDRDLGGPRERDRLHRVGARG